MPNSTGVGALHCGTDIPLKSCVLSFSRSDQGENSEFRVRPSPDVSLDAPRQASDYCNAPCENSLGLGLGRPTKIVEIVPVTANEGPRMTL